MSGPPTLTRWQEDAAMQVYKEIVAGSNRRRDLETMRQEIVNRFGEIGIEVHVIAKAEPEGRDPLHGFEIEIVGFTTKQPTDHERMAWEVQHGLHGGGEGTIGGSGLIGSPRKSF